MKMNDTYPDIKVEMPNVEYAMILLQDYAGTVSEETAIHLYMYQNFLQDGKWDEFAKELEKIAIVEMHHLELLGKTILKLGLNPIFATVNAESDNVIHWNSENVNYTDEIREMLHADIKAEVSAIKQYEIHKEMINDKYIKALLARIIQDEEGHLKIFNELYNSLEKNKP
ncbi:MAG: ferritin-like domain-containing protein [Ignavibacteriales bacterium]